MYFLRITFKSHKKLNQLTQNLLKLKKNNELKNTTVRGIAQKKRKKRIFTLLKSPHVNKKSREHFIYKRYSPTIDIKSENFFSLLDFLILIKKDLSENSIMRVKFIKQKKKNKTMLIA
uniref:Ribosomal protein S10 n=1 Tax=Bremia sonchicola TaxID=502114 RepID=A0A2P1H6N0_9STRA|nr:ribosomal protein S10 [Bremia sonchicola]